MKRSKIMSLSGKRLVRAVAKARGWTMDNDRNISAWVDKREERYPVFMWGVDDYRPDVFFDMTWSLIQDLWDGSHPQQANGKPPVVSCVEITLSDSVPQEVQIKVYSPTLNDVIVDGSDFCVTVCRAYLMVTIGEED